MLDLSIFTSHRPVKLLLGSLALLILLLMVSFAQRLPVTSAIHKQDQPQLTHAVFTNAATIIINDNAVALPYPSTINVSGLAGNILHTPGSVKVTLCNFNHAFPDDVGIVLVGPTGAALLVQDGAGDDADLVDVTYTLSDTGATLLPDPTNWGPGLYKPTAYYINDAFPAPGPGTTYNSPGPTGSGTATFSSTFGGTNPNGVWSLYVMDFEAADIGSIVCGWSLEITAGPVVRTSQAVDFDGDGKTDPAVARNSGGLFTWYILNSQTGTLTSQIWGIVVSDFIVPEDYDGDGKTDIAVWREGLTSGSYFYILQSQTNTLRSDQFGQTGDDPSVVGDYDGDGKADPAVYRHGANPGTPSYWFHRASAGAMAGQIIYQQWGQSGDRPAPGDYDGDGKNDFVIMRANGNNAVFYLLNTTSGQSAFFFGTIVDYIVPGDYDGDGKTDVALVREVSAGNHWYIRRSSDSVIESYIFGIYALDYPTQGDWDGDGKTDIAVWRSGGGIEVFYWRRSSDGAIGTVPWGQTADYPVANFNIH